MERAPALNKALTWADTERSLAIVTPRIRRELTRSIAKGRGTSVRHLPPRGISISLDFVELSRRLLLLMINRSRALESYIQGITPPLLRSAPDTARILCRSFTPKRHRQLR